MPVISLLSRWNAPRVRKESNLQLFDAMFAKYDYQKPMKQRRKRIKDFDPRPEEYRGNAKQLLGTFLKNTREESLGISLLFDEHCCQPSLLNSDTSTPYTPDIKETVKTFKQNLKMSPAQLWHVERSTREQQYSAECFSARGYRIIVSHFGEILHHHRDTPPDRLVLSIFMPRKFSSPAITSGIENKSKAIQAYMEHK